MGKPPPFSLPIELTRYLSQYMKLTDVLAAQLITPNDKRERIDVWISYVPRLKSFTAHRDGLDGEIRASSLSDLCTKIAAMWPEAEIMLHLSKVARAEDTARRRGTPRAEGWH
jgi:hypothetical protein